VVDPVQKTAPVSADNPNGQNVAPPVPPGRVERFSKAMIAAALRPPMVNLADNGPEDDTDPHVIPMKAPVITPAKT